MTIILGIDPGINKVGFGVIKSEGSRVTHLSNGVIKTDKNLSTPMKLVFIHQRLQKILEEVEPDEAAVEKIFVNVNFSTSLSLGEARGIALMTPALNGVKVAEYVPNLVKKTVCGNGHAGKKQIMFMVKKLLPRSEPKTEDAADALAVALTHAHYRQFQTTLEKAREIQKY